ncbi:MAG: sigma-54-dependent transcriptional regulator [Candidatus Aminicenantaceae bacterium]
MERILIVEDNKDMQFILSNILKEEGYHTLITESGEKALKELKKNSFSLVLLDMKLPGIDGMKVMEKIKKINRDMVVIMLTAYGDIKDAVKAMKLGAFDYITKPFETEELVLVIKKAIRTQYLSREVGRLRKRLGEKTQLEEVMGDSPQIKQVLKQMNIVSKTDMTVIIQGESGTGKELIANMIHQKSEHRENPFIIVDCGSIPETLVESELFGYEKGAFSGADSPKEGIFEQAIEGTIFLDEIANLPMAAQAKLLRVLQEKRVQRLGGKKYKKINARIVVATNANLTEAVRKGKFRDDLFHRLNEFIIFMPPLRERKEDIPVLANQFLEEANEEFDNKVKGISDKGIKHLLKYSWPGNVRELKNVMKKAVLLADSKYINPEQFILGDIEQNNEEKPDKELSEGSSLKEIMEKSTRKVEKEMIKQALIKAGGNKAKAAKILKITRTTLYSKIKEFNLNDNP